MSPYEEETGRIRRLLRRGQIRLAYRRLERIGTTYNAQQERQGRWFLEFLDAARAQGDADAITFVAHAELFEFERWQALFDENGETTHVAWVLNECGYLLYVHGQNDLAIEFLEQVVSWFPSRTVARLNLGDAYWKRGSLEQARRQYRWYRDDRHAQGKRIPERVEARLVEP